LSGRRAPPSALTAEEPEDGVTIWRGGVGDREPDGTNGGDAGTENGAAAGVGAGETPAGLNGGRGGGGVNSGISEAGDGGVAVAAAVLRSMDSGLGRGAADVSEVRAGGNPSGPWEVEADADPKIPASQPLEADGPERGRACEDSLGEPGV
jgi:hypothetical protein